MYKNKNVLFYEAQGVGKGFKAAWLREWHIGDASGYCS